MKFSIITPVYNGEKYIAETIESVLSQEGDFEIEYIICDGGSTDGTIEILKKYETWLAEKNFSIRCQEIKFIWFSQKDNGMYDAINMGFKMATGDIYAWINADDLYMPNAFEIILKTFTKFPDVKWLKGITCIIDESSNLIKKLPCYLYNQKWIKHGVYGRNAYFIHQDSVFWKSDLWKKINNINEQFKLAGDYYLWTQFARHSSLWSINIPLSNFRKTGRQLSDDMNNYRKEQNIISPSPKNWLIFRIKLFFWLKSKTSLMFNPFFFLLYKLLFWSKNKYYIEIQDSQPTIKKARSYIA